MTEQSRTSLPSETAHRTDEGPLILPRSMRRRSPVVRPSPRRHGGGSGASLDIAGYGALADRRAPHPDAEPPGGVGRNELGRPRRPAVLVERLVLNQADVVDDDLPSADPLSVHAAAAAERLLPARAGRKHGLVAARVQ